MTLQATAPGCPEPSWESPRKVSSGPERFRAASSGSEFSGLQEKRGNDGAGRSFRIPVAVLEARHARTPDAA
jgi:hypothetical protein